VGAAFEMKAHDHGEDGIRLSAECSSFHSSSLPLSVKSAADDAPMAAELEVLFVQPRWPRPF
jgi:hypothetical protein